MKTPDTPQAKRPATTAAHGRTKTYETAVPTSSNSC
jgi:hypothetical protein